ncbi:MAG TPA: hypothetical protein VMV10_22655 [Pirellulales bacterium]|nr:hypothetical protein [Pirellulales bacterium]
MTALYLRRLASLAIAIVCAFLAWTETHLAAEDQPNKEPSSLRELIDAALDDVQIFADAETTVAARPRVVMRWANNARGSEDGATVLYIHEGRPLAVACFYPWDGQLPRDFSVLARVPIVARYGGAVVWHPQRTEVELAGIPAAPPPESNKPQRLRQMKSLAEQFGSTMLGWRADDSDREELRLLPRPLYRYETTGGEVIDGAVFAFVMGADPESLLLIEATKQGDAAKWQYAFVRRTSGELEGRHRGQTVWHADRFPAMRDAQGPNFSVVSPIPPELLPAKEAQ